MGAFTLTLPFLEIAGYATRTFIGESQPQNSKTIGVSLNQAGVQTCTVDVSGAHGLTGEVVL